MLELFQSIQQATALPLLFITHDFAVVTRLAHRVAVMRFGRLVELGPTAAIMRNPQHPYTRALIASVEGYATLTPPSRGHRIGAPGSQRHWAPLRHLGAGHYLAEPED